MTFVSDGKFIPKGTSLLIAMVIMGRMKSIWEDPEAFIPERFLPENFNSNSFAFVPFSAGSRNCIGNITTNISNSPDFPSQLSFRAKVCNARDENHNFKGFAKLRNRFAVRLRASLGCGVDFKTRKRIVSRTEETGNN